MDMVTTQIALSRGAREAYLPDWIAHHWAADEAYGLGVVGVEWLASRRIRKMGHPKLARLVPWADMGYDGWYAAHNLTQGRAAGTGAGAAAGGHRLKFGR